MPTRFTLRLLIAGSVALAAGCSEATSPFTPEDAPGASRAPEHAQERIAALRETISHQVLPMPGAVFVGEDPEGGPIMIGVQNLAMAGGIERALAARGVESGDYRIVEQEPIEFLSTSLRTAHRPTVGGLQITASGGYLCTLGFNVSHSAGRSFITNSHCTDRQGSNSGTRYYQSTTSNSAIVADEAHDPGYWTGSGCPSGRVCRRSDSARALYRSGTSSTRGRIAKPSGVNNGSLTVSGHFTITSQDASTTNFSGTMNKVGRTTGWSRGSVSSTCANVNVSGTNITLLCQTLVSANSAGGDSGSPVFRVTSGDNVQLVGIMWGGGTGTFAFSPLRWVTQELGSMTATF